MLDGVISLIEGDCARSKFLCAVGKPKNGVSECIVEGFPDVKVQYLFGFLVIIC